MGKKFTSWFDGTSDHPQRNGVFQRKRIPHRAFGNSKPAIQRYALFQDGIWYCEASSPAAAVKQFGNESAYQFLPWRGMVQS